MKGLRVLLVAGSAMIPGLSAWAQSSGPVHLPPASAPTNSAPAAPASATAPIIFNQPAPAPANPSVAPAPSSPTLPSSAGDEDIHDIRGPLVIPYPLGWLYEIAAALVLLALAYAAWRYFRRAAKVRGKLPHQIALERLEAARPLMTDARVREYAFAVSEVVRVYIEQRFGERAARRTTEEFIADLLRQTDTPLARHRALLEDFLHHCDLPKFARWQLSPREMESMHDSARAFILSTEPNAAPAPSAAAPVVSIPASAR